MEQASRAPKREGRITDAQLDAAIRESRKTKRSVDRLLVESGAGDDEDVARALSALTHLPLCDLGSVAVDLDAVRLLPKEWANKYQCLPVTLLDRGLVVAVADPLDMEMMQNLAFICGRSVRPVIAPRRAIADAVEQFYNLDLTIGLILGNVQETAKVEAEWQQARGRLQSAFDEPAGGRDQEQQRPPDREQEKEKEKLKEVEKLKWEKELEAERERDRQREEEATKQRHKEEEPALDADKALRVAADLVAAAEAQSGGEARTEVVEEEMDEIAGGASGAEEAPIIRLVNLLLSQALARRASDIHIEPHRKFVQVRFRIDGELVPHMQVPKWMHNAVVTRIKVLSKLDIANRRSPQDGGIKLNIDNKRIDVRVSILPTQYGEKAVMRVHSAASGTQNLEQVGFLGTDLERFRTAAQKPQGMILVTGPTGSGKTTTLHATLKYIRSDSINIITVEDPVEYEIPGINQVQVHEEAGLSFANCLRSILRQDPNVIMVGEIRDSETAEIAFKASLTGHLVFSTLHTNDAPATITRLFDIGMAPYLVASSVLLVVAQRLVRLNCRRCLEPYHPELLKMLESTWGPAPKDAKFMRGRGCPACNQTGFKGRIGVLETMDISAKLRELIAQRSTDDAIRQVAISEGMTPLFDAGLKRVFGGETTLEELIKVAMQTSDEKAKANPCPECKREIVAGFRVCPFCGFALSSICPACNREVQPGWVLCAFCGYSLGKPAGPGPLPGVPLVPAAAASSLPLPAALAAAAIPAGLAPGMAAGRPPADALLAVGATASGFPLPPGLSSAMLAAGLGASAATGPSPEPRLGALGSAAVGGGPAAPAASGAAGAMGIAGLAPGAAAGASPAAAASGPLGSGATGIGTSAAASASGAGGAAGAASAGTGAAAASAPTGDGLPLPPTAGQPPPLGTEGDLPRPKVLVVDDEPSILLTIRLALTEMGCEVMTAGDGKEALGKVRAHKPNLIITDVIMPEMDGFAFVKQVRQAVDTAFIPIIMLTSRSSAEDRLRGFAQGTDDYMAKPFQYREVQARVQSLLRRTYGWPATPASGTAS